MLFNILVSSHRWLLSSWKDMLLKLISPVSLLSLAQLWENVKYVLYICGLHFISVGWCSFKGKAYSELRTNYHGMGNTICQNSPNVCQPNDPCLLFSYLINSHTQECQTATRKWVLISYIVISYRKKEPSLVKRKIRSSVLITLTLREYIPGEGKYGNWRQSTAAGE